MKPVLSKAGTGWPPPVDFIRRANPAPPFQPRLLPAPFSTFVGDVADRMQVPADFVAIPVIVATATMVGRDFRLAPMRHDNWSERACLWGAVIAPPGAKKSPPMAEAMRPIKKFQAEMWDHFREAHDPWSQGDKKDRGPEPLAERVMTSEATVEALVGLMSGDRNANPRGMVLYRDELSGWFDSMNKYRRGDDRQFFLECWSGGSYSIDRKKDGSTFVDDLYLNVVGTIQPKVIERALKDGDADGLTGRFQLMAYPDLPDRVDLVDRVPDLAAIEGYERRLRQIRAAKAENGSALLRFSGEAAAIFHRWLLKNENRPERRAEDAFGTHLAKYPALFARLALVLHSMLPAGLAQHEVGAETAEAARSIVDDYLEPHARKVYGRIAEHPAHAGAVRIARWIQQRKLPEFAARDIRRNDWREFSQIRDHDGIEASLRYLEAMDWIDLEDRPAGMRGGRPTKVAKVNPAVLDD